MMDQDVLPLTTLVPENASLPVVVYDDHSALRMAVVERAGAHLLPAEDWDVPGVYMLLDRPTPDGDWGVYVGKAPAGMKARLTQHLRAKDYWTRAVLVRRDTTFGFNSAQLGWLEGRLYDLFAAAENALLHNGVRPSDETLPPYDRQMLELMVLPMRRLLRLLGYDPATADDTTTSTPPKKTSRFYGITVAQVIQGGHLAPGAELVSTNGAWPATATILPDGRIRTGGAVYDTPSAAAVAIKGGAANGWDFWAVESSTGKVTLGTLRARLLGKTQRPAS